jgi:glycosyltransferase involved in cell wall biosynthesis
MGKKLTIITINLNNIEGLQKTFESVFNQLFSGFEYIVIDGGSTDGCLELLKRNNDKITYWESKPDSGVFHAMNKGIRKASGEYLLFLNSGDFLLHDNVLNNIFRDSYSQDILCGTSIISKNGEALYDSAPPDEFTLRFFSNRNIPHQSTFIKKDLFDKYGLYREDFKIKSDYEFWIRAIIINNCTTIRLNKWVSDYNLNGISSKPENVELAHNEMKKAFELNLPPRILTEFVPWLEEPTEMDMLFWAKSNKAVFLIVKIIYKIAVIFFFLKRIFRKRNTL